DLDELLVRVLATALRRHVGDGALENLQERLLHALTGHVPGDRRVLGLARYFIDLVDVHDATFGALDVVVGRLQQSQDDVFHVLPDVPGLSQGWGVGDGERHPEHLGERLREQCLARAGGADHEDVRLLQLDVARSAAARLDPLVVVVHRHRQDLLGALLADHVLVEDGLDLGRLRQAPELARLLLFPLLRDDVVAQLDAFVADVNGGAGDELADVVLALATERAPQGSVAFAGAGHRLATSGARVRLLRSPVGSSAWRKSLHRRSYIPWPARRS